MNNITPEEIEQVLQYFDKLGYKRDTKDVYKLTELADLFPDKDAVKCAQEMYLWFDEAGKRGRKIKSFHMTLKNWIQKDYAPKKQKPKDFFERDDLV